MADTEAAPPPSTATAEVPPTKSSKKSAKKKTVSKRAKLEHPKYTEMIAEAIKVLKERGGSSRQAILKYIMTHFDVGDDPKVVNVHLKLGLKRGVATNVLKHSKGQGASGSFLIAVDGSNVIVKSNRPQRVLPSKTKSSAGKKAKKPKFAVEKPVAKTQKKVAVVAAPAAKAVKAKGAKVKKTKSPKKKATKVAKGSAIKRKSATPKKPKPARVRIWLKKGEKALPSGKITFSASPNRRKSAAKK